MKSQLPTDLDQASEPTPYKAPGEAESPEAQILKMMTPSKKGFHYGAGAKSDKFPLLKKTIGASSRARKLSANKALGIKKKMKGPAF